MNRVHVGERLDGAAPVHRCSSRACSHIEASTGRGRIIPGTMRVGRYSGPMSAEILSDAN